MPALNEKFTGRKDTKTLKKQLGNKKRNFVPSSLSGLKNSLATKTLRHEEKPEENNSKTLCAFVPSWPHHQPFKI
jgi:hypothetical protein